MSMLSLTNVVDVVVSIQKTAAARCDFDTGLIIADVDIGKRCETVVSAGELLTLGFSAQSGAYRAASLYFMQSQRPASLIVGARYEDETALDAIMALREENADFYGFYLCDATEDEILILSEWALENRCVYFYDVCEKPTDIPNSVFSLLKGASMKNTFGLYSASPYAAAGVMGLSMGLTKRTAGSAFALSYKTIAGIEPDALTEGEVTSLKSVNANVYILRGNAFSVLEKGVMADGSPYDEVMGLHRLAGDIQMSVMDLLTGTGTKIPHTDAGMLSFITAINGELEKSRSYGFIAPGTWTGDSVLKLETGDPLETGYLVQAESVSSQTRAERDARKAPPIYVCAKLAGAIEHVVIKVDIDR